tara:strand:- start:3380 stop:3754 length:375 start_codon:yes stop_codon:yes gene_type:complete
MKNKNNKIPKPIGPYSAAVNYNDLIFTSGQIPIDPITSKLIEGNFKMRVEKVLNNIKNLLDEKNSSLKNIIKLTVYLTDLSKFNDLNDVFIKTFPNNPPARSVVEVCKLPMDSDIEIECIAYKI